MSRSAREAQNARGAAEEDEGSWGGGRCQGTEAALRGPEWGVQVVVTPRPTVGPSIKALWFTCAPRGSPFWPGGPALTQDMHGCPS